MNVSFSKHLLLVKSQSSEDSSEEVFTILFEINTLDNFKTVSARM